MSTTNTNVKTDELLEPICIQLSESERQFLAFLKARENEMPFEEIVGAFREMLIATGRLDEELATWTVAQHIVLLSRCGLIRPDALCTSGLLLL